MEINFARKLVKDALQHSFEKERFTYLVKNLLNKIEETPQTVYRGNYIPDAYKEYITTLERIGKYEDPDGKKLDILVISLAKATSLERARTMQRNFIAWYLNGSRGGELKDAALAAFVAPDEDDWRFSFIKMEYKLVETAKGVKAEEEFTPARRYSFLVGKNETTHTAQSRLVPILCEDERDPTLKELEDIFGIEKVTREFFENYRDLFLRLKESLDEIVKKNDKIKTDFEAKSVDTINFAKKLLGQIVFLYFLQKKGWFGVKRGREWGSGSKHFLRQLFEKRHSDYKNFFNDILEPLFYEALRQDRSYDKDYYSRFDCRIPFLNGGLFDPINDYDWVDTDILLPNELFSNTEKTKQGDIGTGILDVFDRYNFTVKEDEPLEKEVAIDPEMLGKVFENLLEVKDRKSKGTYYTPREIVHYMGQQSLINYLDTALDIEKKPLTPEKPIQSKFFGDAEPQQMSLRTAAIPKEDITFLIQHGQSILEHDKRVVTEGKETKRYPYRMPQSIRENAATIDKALESIRACDPAVGSGAFLVGMMHEIVNARLVLSTYLNNPKNRTQYGFKRDAIQNCLYGVDIDPSAVEIAKLRLWLSLVVDEEDIKQIKPLPNLDYKIIQGNSLIELLHTELLASTTDHRRTELVKELRKEKDELFNITAPTEKEKKRRQIDILMKNLFEYDRNKQIERLKNVISAEKSQRIIFEDDEIDKIKIEKKIREIENDIEEIQDIEIPGPTEHFEWHINYSEIFQEKGGFDATIGNPPYGADLNEVDKKLFKSIYDDVHVRTPDTFNYFVSQGFRILNIGGILSYIVSNNLLFQNECVKTRKLFCENKRILRVINLGDAVFENVTVPSCVFVVRNSAEEKYQFEYLDLRSRYQEDKSTLLNSTSSIYTKNDLLRSPSIVFGISRNTVDLIEKVRLSSFEIDDIAEEVASGISTGGDSVFRITREFARKNNFEADILYPVLVGREIDRYYIKETDHLIIYTQKDVPIRKYKNIYNYLLPFKENLSKKRETRKGILPWWCLHWSRYKDLFSGTKIILRQTSDEIRAAIDNKDFFVLNSILVLKLVPKCNIDYKFALAILNSSLNNFIYQNITQEAGRTFAEVKPKNVRKLFIPKVSSGEQQKFAELADRITSLCADGNYLEDSGRTKKVKDLEKQIDQMVYKLYDLTPDEIAIIENRQIQRIWNRNKAKK